MPVYDPTIWDNPAAKEFLAGILMLDNKSVAEAFLADVLTTSEIKEFGNRLKTAKMIKAGESYENIKKETGMSTTTIARVSEWLKTGAGGYDLILRRLNSEHHSHISPDTTA